MENLKIMKGVQENFTKVSLQQKLVIAFWCIATIVLILSGVGTPVG